MSFIETLAIVAQFIAIHSASITQKEGKSLLSKPDEYNSSQIYTFGGQNGDDVFKSVLPSASRLNSTTGKWEPVSSMLEPDHVFCGAVSGKQIYLFGGFKTLSKNDQLASAHVYGCLTDTYKTLRSLPETRAHCGAAALEDSIYVAGGKIGDWWKSSNSSCSSSFIRYDIRKNQWSTLSPMNAPRHGLELVELGGLLYAIGGRCQNKDSDVVKVYNTTTGRWTSVASTHNYHYHFGAAIHEGKIYVLSYNGFEVYSPDTNEWTELNIHSSHQYHGSKLVAMNGQLWATGGRSREGEKITYTKEVYTYDISTDRWTRQPDMDVPRTFHAAFVVNH